MPGGRLDWEKSKELLLTVGLSNTSAKDVQIKLDDEQTQVQMFLLIQKRGLGIIAGGLAIAAAGITLSIAGTMSSTGFLLAIGVILGGLGTAIYGWTLRQQSKKSIDSLINDRSFWLSKYL